MNGSVHDSPDRADPERLLARGLRDTTPEFEARFDDLRRSLAHEPPRRGILDVLGKAMRMRPAWLGAAVAVAGLALAFAIIQTRLPRGAVPDGIEEQWYADVVVLDDSLRDALVLSEGETREVLSHMPVETPGGES